MSHHQSQGTYKHDKPAWKWRGTGVHAYTSQPTEAARYVALCRQREIDKVFRRGQATVQRYVAAMTDSARLIEAASRIGRAA